MKINEIELKPYEQRAMQSEPIFLQILQDCKPHLSAIDYDVAKYNLYRGIKNATDKFGKKTVRLTDRSPMDTPQELHDELNAYFDQKYGHPYRNGVFATPRKKNAEFYGTSFSIYPIGNYEMIHNEKIMDLTDQVVVTYQELKHWGEKPPIGKFLEDNWPPYSTNNPKRAALSGNESMIWCKEYYYLAQSLATDFYIYMKLKGIKT